MVARILVVEPVRPVARAIAAVLERHGHEVIAVGNAAEANQHPGRFDCGVFSDKLPDKSGISLAGWLLAEDRVACVVFFGHADDVDTRLRASNLGTYLHRDDGLHALSAAIDETIAETRERAQAVGAEGERGGRPELKSGKRRKR